MQRGVLRWATVSASWRHCRVGIANRRAELIRVAEETGLHGGEEAPRNCDTASEG
jgi:hypothetical protein